ncbi:DUF1569 domain-containing protein [Pedobacter sp. ISL-68]|uniref:DUF1569 domain-containing protein n=1 Tax=unclassified Pedobacter TaxID=2628915 RepID=UPI001BEB47CE|nr:MULTISPECIES: DUF1569 domain-containing protein [unclassified Pedobacter]MBT2560191.1 DUF1569 domain-containing protein [Pedobacter sp. ISL-64]MBT2589170.1 DUF1569 domain-containing protein [Pedobacter sp. ISL-68]
MSQKSETEKVGSKEFFTPKALSVYTKRINRLTPHSERQWGTMEADQMLHHLNLACGSSLGYFNLADESTFLTRTIFKWLLIDILPQMPKGLKMPVGFKIPLNRHFDFEQEKNILLEIIATATSSKSTSSWTAHVGFGHLSNSQWAKLLSKHIDYHLKQFGV